MAFHLSTALQHTCHSSNYYQFKRPPILSWVTLSLIAFSAFSVYGQYKYDFQVIVAKKSLSEYTFNENLD